MGKISKRDFMALLGLTFLLHVCTVPRIIGPWSIIHAFGLIDIVNKPHIQKIQIFNRENLESIAQLVTDFLGRKKIQSLHIYILVREIRSTSVCDKVILLH